MRIVVLTEAGATPLSTGDLADELTRRIGVLTTRGAVRAALADIERDLRDRTATLAEVHK